LKIKKKTAMALSFAVGTMLFATTAMAEINSKSGYDQLKDAAKYTAESFSEKLSSYTIDTSFVLKDNESVIVTEDSTRKYDASKKAMETVSKVTDGTKKLESYYYVDKDGYITRNSGQDTYHVIEYSNPKEGYSFVNPFKDEAAGDVEKIVDALIGNLKDYVVVSENPDGSKELSGSLNEAQIPAIANALVSYNIKQKIGYQNPSSSTQIPIIIKDIFVREVKGNMAIDKAGFVQRFLGTGVICGKDEQGKEHSLTFEMLGKITNVNSTTLNRPDLSGAKVEKTINENYDRISNTQMYLGSYKDDIIIKKDDKFEKIGERFVEITELTDKSIAGRYHEEYKKGYESYSSNAKDFNFNVKLDNTYFGEFTGKDASGKNYKGSISINSYTARLFFNINEAPQSNLLPVGELRKILD
jgi:hypothetical protein